jgi:hypothetical protein
VDLAGSLLVMISRTTIGKLGVMKLVVGLEMMAKIVTTVVSLVLLALAGASWLLSPGRQMMTGTGRACLTRLFLQP